MDRALYHVHDQLPERHWWFRGRRDIAASLLIKLWGQKKWSAGLDLGAGGGSMVSLLKSFVITLDILEPDTQLGVSLRTKYAGTVTVIISTIEDFQTEKKYGVVSLFDVLEHLENDTQALAKIYSSLVPGGRLILTVPAYHFLWSRHDERAGHFRRYTKRKLIGKLIQTGFAIERATYFNTLLFPLVWAVRLVHRFRPQSETDFSYGSGPVNNILYFIFASERFLLQVFNLPFGVSIFCVGIKK